MGCSYVWADNYGCSTYQGSTLFSSPLVINVDNFILKLKFLLNLAKVDIAFLVLIFLFIGYYELTDPTPIKKRIYLLIKYESYIVTLKGENFWSM